MPVYAVTGAAGHLGGLAVQQLLARGVGPSDIVAVVRTQGKAGDLATRGVQVRVADYSSPRDVAVAMAGVDRLLLVSGNEDGRRVAQHASVATAARAAGVARIAYTSMLGAGHASDPLVADHQDSERAIEAAGVPVTMLRNCLYLERYTARLGEYLRTGEIVGAAGIGRMSAATRLDYAAAAVAALVHDEGGNKTYELGGQAIAVAELALVISEVTGTNVTYRDLPAGQYAGELRRAGLDAATALLVAGIDESISRGDLQTGSTDLPDLLGRAPTTPMAAVRAAYQSL